MFFKPMRFLFLLFGLIIFLKPSCQPDSKSEATSIGVLVHYGSFVTVAPKAAYLKDSYTYFGELNFSMPVNGTDKVPGKLPHWGFALFYGNTGSRQYIGNMAGLFPFADFNLLKIKSFTSSVRTGLGAAFIEKPYNPETNHKNVLLGSHVNVYINVLWKNQFRLSKRVSANASLSFSHLSNANTKLPNLGLNVPAFSTGLSYAINSIRVTSVQLKDSLVRRWRIRLHASIGVKESPWIKSNSYMTAVWSAGLVKQNNRSNYLGFGIGFFYDPSLEHQYLDTIVTIGVTKRPAANFGPFASYEKIIGRISIPIQLGIYVLDQSMGTFYQNIGIRYKINRHWSAGGYLKAHWGKADFLHGGLDYTF